MGTMLRSSAEACSGANVQMKKMMWGRNGPIHWLDLHFLKKNEHILTQMEKDIFTQIHYYFTLQRSVTSSCILMVENSWFY